MRREAMMILGLNGMSGQTPAVQALMRTGAKSGARKKTTTRRKKRVTRRRKTSSTPKKRTYARSAKKRTAKRPARLVKGSAAAKRHMAKLRKMRRK